jgi:hypothetical protein
MRIFVVMLTTALAVVALAFASTASAEPANGNPNAALVFAGQGPGQGCFIFAGSNVYSAKVSTFVLTSSGQASFHCHAKLESGDPDAVEDLVLFDDVVFNFGPALMVCDVTADGKRADWTCKEA